MKILFNTLLIFSALNSMAQTVEYEIVTDNPDVLPSSYLYGYYFDYEGSLLADVDARNSAVGSLGISLDFSHALTPKILIQPKTEIRLIICSEIKIIKINGVDNENIWFSFLMSVSPCFQRCSEAFLYYPLIMSQTSKTCIVCKSIGSVPIKSS